MFTARDRILPPPDFVVAAACNEALTVVASSSEWKRSRVKRDKLLPSDLHRTSAPFRLRTVHGTPLSVTNLPGWPTRPASQGKNSIPRSSVVLKPGCVDFQTFFC
ncbi:hypothetical protein G3M48_002754, partial [Beauveria asiatica]